MEETTIDIYIIKKKQIERWKKNQKRKRSKVLE